MKSAMRVSDSQYELGAKGQPQRYFKSVIAGNTFDGGCSYLVKWPLYSVNIIAKISSGQ